jgi:hypothetical protein
MNNPPTPRRWSTGARLLLAFAALSLVVALTTAGVAAAAILHAGTIGVEVENDDGTDVSVVVPAGLANVAIALVPTHLLGEVRDELDRWVPVAESGYREFLEAPDFTLVEINDGDEHVTVRKVGRRVEILVEADGERVHVRLPLRTVGRVLDKLS